jgi:hypothetical protein
MRGRKSVEWDALSTKAQSQPLSPKLPNNRRSLGMAGATNPVKTYFPIPPFFVLYTTLRCYHTTNTPLYLHQHVFFTLLLHCYFCSALFQLFLQQLHSVPPLYACSTTRRACTPQLLCSCRLRSPQPTKFQRTLKLRLAGRA